MRLELIFLLWFCYKQTLKRKKNFSLLKISRYSFIKCKTTMGIKGKEKCIQKWHYKLSISNFDSKDKKQRVDIHIHILYCHIISLNSHAVLRPF